MQEKEQNKDIVIDQIEIFNGKGEKATIKKSISKSIILEKINEIKFENIETFQIIKVTTILILLKLLNLILMKMI